MSKERPASCGFGIRVPPKGSPLGKPPRPFGYGAELTNERMEQALDVESHARNRRHRSAPSVGPAAGAHATHVASIAAGNAACAPTLSSRAC